MIIIDYGEQHRLPLKLGITILHNILSKKSVLDPSSVVINFYSEGDIKVFHKLREAFPLTKFFLGNESTVLRDIDHMAAADILIGGPSSFTSLASALNKNGVHVVPRIKNPAEDKFLGIDNTVGYHKIASGDLSEFNTVVCNAKLYINNRQILKCD